MIKRLGKKAVNHAVILAILLSIMNAVYMPAFACTNSFFAGTVWYNRQNLRIGVNSSAINTVLTFDVYHSILGTGRWNNLHTPERVRVGTVIPLATAPGAIRDIDVVGASLSSILLGQVVAFNSAGTVVGMDSNWSSARIEMNNNISIWNNFSANERDSRTRNAFYHEVGHIFKLSHPNCNIGAANAIMVGASSTTTTVQQHDAANILAKWG
jgi:hypothetical protein